MRRSKALTVAGRELAGLFRSPAALLFIAVFLGVTLFVFFWAATFFERDLADVRPLFQWMPLLLIFLVAALTMRSWAEERRSGTVELLLTSSMSPWQIVLGKFLGAMGLVLIALALTLPLPVTVAMIGPLDWGPVIGGYVAAVLLAAAYVAIGLWVSSRTDNQIVSLILTLVIAGAFYLLGSDALTSLTSYQAGAWLRLLGAGSRFASITRGVLDLRDLYFYVSVTAAFLALNRLSLETQRWAGNPRSGAHRRWYWLTALLAANALAGNLWLGQLHRARIDLTAGGLYTLSDATRSYLAELREPLLIRGYFSSATHPLLAPLVPQLRDLLQEYAVAGNGRVRVEFVDPHDDPKLESEANGRYGIRPVPFQVSGKYQSSVVNSYFDILVSYGDQFQVLGFRDLIDVKQSGETRLDVELSNPEYAITGAIRKVLTSYQAGGGLFDTLRRPLTFTGYISAAQALPAQLQKSRDALQTVLRDLLAQAHGMLKVNMQDPDGDSALMARLQRDFGFQPMVVSLLDPQQFWFYMTLSDGQRTETVPMPANLDAAGLKAALRAAIQRFSPGFLRTVAVLGPAAPPQMGSPGGGLDSYTTLREVLGDSAHLLDTDLHDGSVPPEADLLLLLDPTELDEKQLFAIDQFLMKGGTVVVASSPIDVRIAQSIAGQQQRSGLEQWLAGYGLSFGKGLVLDTQSGALPLPVERDLGGVTVREIALAKYPYIVDVRGKGLNADSPITRRLGQIDVPWAAPVLYTPKAATSRKLTTLLSSSLDSWLSDSTNLTPDYRNHPDGGFAVGQARRAEPLAVMVEGVFDSAFKGKPSPLLAEPQKPSTGKPDTGAAASSANAAALAATVIDHSPASARLIVIGSSALFSDAAAALIGQGLGSRYLKPAEFAQNLIEWSLEDRSLMSIRSREHSARTLRPLDRGAQQFWEYLNYALALGGLALTWLLSQQRRRRNGLRHRSLLRET
jgi:ABC-2 type transport system permease protein